MPSTAKAIACPKIAKIGSLYTLLAFFISIWESSMALKLSREFFRALDEPQLPFEIGWWSG
jgi:hypothetical protein